MQDSKIPNPDISAWPALNTILFVLKRTIMLLLYLAYEPHTSVIRCVACSRTVKYIKFLYRGLCVIVVESYAEGQCQRVTCRDRMCHLRLHES